MERCVSLTVTDTQPLLQSLSGKAKTLGNDKDRPMFRNFSMHWNMDIWKLQIVSEKALISTKLITLENDKDQSWEACQSIGADESE